MSRRARHLLILVSVVVLTALGVATAHAPVVARTATTDRALREAPVEGQMFRVHVLTTNGCSGPDIWEFREGGELVGQTISSASSWNQQRPRHWEANVGVVCGFFEIAGWSFDRVIFASGFGPDVEIMLVVGVRL